MRYTIAAFLLGSCAMLPSQQAEDAMQAQQAESTHAAESPRRKRVAVERPESPARSPKPAQPVCAPKVEDRRAQMLDKLDCLLKEIK